MADKCGMCDGHGLVVAGYGMWRCSACERYTQEKARERIRLCCEGHDGLVEACVEAANLFDELIITGALIHHAKQVYDLAAALHARVAKAQPPKEPSTTHEEAT